MKAVLRGENDGSPPPPQRRLGASIKHAIPARAARACGKIQTDPLLYNMICTIMISKTMISKTTASVLLRSLGILLVLCGLVQGQSPLGSPSRLTLDPVQPVTVQAGHESPVEFTFHIVHGFHVNSNQPLTPELIPTQIHFSGPDGVVIGKLKYPSGELMSFPFDPSNKLSVYSGEGTIKAVVIAQPGASSGPYNVHGELKYQACDNNACYPPKKLPVEFTVKIAAAARSHSHSSPQSPHIH